MTPCSPTGRTSIELGCTMPTGGVRWLPTRQPVVVDLWPVEAGDPSAPFTSVMNWSSVGDREYEGRLYGEKPREFAPFFTLPRDTGEAMEFAINAPGEVRDRLRSGGWRFADARQVTRTPWTYQDYLRASRAEFAVARHAYVSTQCGWFSDRSSAYLAMGRPVILQDTGFSAFLPGGRPVAVSQPTRRSGCGSSDPTTRPIAGRPGMLLRSTSMRVACSASCSNGACSGDGRATSEPGHPRRQRCWICASRAWST